MTLERTVLYLVTEDWYFVSHRLVLARAARASGYRVIVVTRVGDQGETIRAAGIELIPVSWQRRGGGLFKELRALIDLVRIYRRIRPDIVHHVALKPIVYGSIAAFCSRSTKVVNALAGFGYSAGHKDVFSSLISVLVRTAVTVTSRLAGATMIFQNKDDLAYAVKKHMVKGERAVLIRGSGVDVTQFSVNPFPQGQCVVVFASRMLWAKGPADFVAAATVLINSGVTARFVLVGDTDEGNPRAVPRTTLRKWADYDGVEWWGYRDDMREVFAQAHVVALPTTYGEGIPKVLIEAAACGRPMVANDVPGCREIVQDGVTGYLVPPGDSIALSNALRELIEDENKRATFGRHARAAVEKNFSAQRVTAETLQLYQNITAGRSLVAD